MKADVLGGMKCIAQMERSILLSRVVREFGSVGGGEKVSDLADLPDLPVPPE